MVAITAGLASPSAALDTRLAKREHGVAWAFDLASTPSELPMYDWQKEELARRKANLMNNPASGLSWDEVKRVIRSRLVR